MIRKGSNIALPSHSVRIIKTGSQAITAFADTVITLGTVDVRSGNYIDTSTADKLTALVPGLYLATFEVWFQGGTAGERNVILKVGSASVRETGLSAAGRVSGAATIRLTSGQQLGLNCYVAANSVAVNGSATKDVGLTLTYLGT